MLTLIRLVLFGNGLDHQLETGQHLPVIASLFLSIPDHTTMVRIDGHRDRIRQWHRRVGFGYNL